MNSNSDNGTNRQEIARRAHGKWQSRVSGNPIQDWLTAEAEIQQSHRVDQHVQRLEETMRQQDQERRLAKEIQRGLLPKVAAIPCGLAMCGRSNPSNNVGGDYFDYFLMIDGSVGVVIGDASGHGISAALLIAETRAYLRALALTSNNPADILTITNQRLSQDLTSGFVTLLLVQIDPRTHALHFAGAGHCPGYVISPSGETTASLVSEGLPLGIDSTFQFPTSTAISVEPGDLVFLYTDGLIEAGVANRRDLFGIERALEIVRVHRTKTPDEILDALFHAVNNFSDSPNELDDVTAVLIQV